MGGVHRGTTHKGDSNNTNSCKPGDNNFSRLKFNALVFTGSWSLGVGAVEVDGL